MSSSQKRSLKDFAFEQIERKRSRTSPVPDPSDSSATSSDPSMSEVSAMQSTPPRETYRRSMSVSSVSEEESDSSEYESSSEEDEDSDDSADDSEAEDEIVTIGGPVKPSIRKPKTGAFDLKSRLAAFLPQLAAANSELERLRAEGGLEGMSMEDVDEEEGGYIEMDLGLGVLEEKRDGEESGDEEGEDADADTMDEESKKQKEKDVLGRMMGFKGGRQAAGIEEVGGA